MTTYHDFLSRFGFNATPFTRELSIGDRFLPQSHQTILAHLKQTIDQRMSAALIAPAGCGKTTLLRALRAQLPETSYRCSYLKVTDLSKRDFCRELSHALGLQSAGTYPMLLRRLQERMESGSFEEGINWVVILDEAQEFRPDVLGVLRILTNFEMDSRLVVALVLAGQTPLKTLLKREALRAVTDRLAHIAQLEPLSQSELDQYLEHRCRIAGLDNPPFDKDARRAVYEISRGNFRACDRLALKALQVAHDANVDRVNANHIGVARSLVSCAN